MCNCSESNPSSGGSRKHNVPTSAAGPIVTPAVPLSRSIAVTAEAEGTAVADQPGGPTPQPAPNTPVPSLTPCHLNFRDGCYVITYRPTGSPVTFEGTLRVDRSAPDGGPDNIIVSGDLYTAPAGHDAIVPVAVPTPAPSEGDIEGAEAATEARAPSVAAAVSAVDAPSLPTIFRRPKIPIFSRSRYHSYLRVTSVTVPVIPTPQGLCQITLVAEQYNYTQPPAGQHKGTFPNAPSRTVTIKLKKTAAPPPFSLTGGPYYDGRLFVAGVDKGSVRLGWVSRFFRRASVEVDTLTGSVRPAPVPDGAGSMDFFDTIFAKIGWQLRVVDDQTNIPVPAGVTATNCWSSADLHNLMTTVRNPSTDLDKEWRIHLIVVPAKLGCGRGVMYDQIGVPREACASFSDDGYPTGDSSNFGTAANKKQRDVPRAFLRSATHEITHTLNQIHQEQETSADNSIMTTTPSVADVLGGPTTGAPGVFPDQINLAHNTTVRHHLNHMPDPVIRPGGWPFGSWFPTGAPQASDRHLFDASELELVVTCAPARVALGEPVELAWTLTNRSGSALLAPNNVSIEALFAAITITDGEGQARPMRTFVILCENAKIDVLEPGQAVSASSRVFWSSAGFAFERPGQYRVTVSITWSAQGIPVGVERGVDVFIEYPTNDADNRAAGLVMHPDVGKWVALGGGAYHLGEAVRRLLELSSMPTADRDNGGPRLLKGFDGLLPDRRRASVASPSVAGATRRKTGGARTAARPTRPARRGPKGGRKRS
jgi:hypothetical protein